jgi:hypothetical protein
MGVRCGFTPRPLYPFWHEITSTVHTSQHCQTTYEPTNQPTTVVIWVMVKFYPTEGFTITETGNNKIFTVLIIISPTSSCTMNSLSQWTALHRITNTITLQTLYKNVSQRLYNPLYISKWIQQWRLVKPKMKNWCSFPLLKLRSSS